MNVSLELIDIFKGIITLIFSISQNYTSFTSCYFFYFKIYLKTCQNLYNMMSISIFTCFGKIYGLNLKFLICRGALYSRGLCSLGNVCQWVCVSLGITFAGLIFKGALFILGIWRYSWKAKLDYIQKYNSALKNFLHEI